MKFEEYIRKTRASLDVEKTDEEYLWKGISDGISRKKIFRQSLFWKIAAGILLLITTGLLLQNGINQNRNNVKLLFTGMGEDMVHQETVLIQKINSYQEQLNNQSFDKKKLTTEFSEIKKIDRLIKQYSRDLDQFGPDPRILNTLMDLYQKKIMVLDRMLNEIQKTKTNENDKINI